MGNEYQGTIDTKRINGDGEKIIEYGDKMTKALEEIQKIVASTNDCFDSDAGAELRNSIKSVAEEFVSFKTYVKDYGSWLKEYGRVHDEIDNEIEELAASILAKQ